MARENLFSQLEKVLSRQHELAGQMLAAARRQNDALRRNDITILTRAVDELEQLNGPMRQLEEEREALQARLAGALALPPGAPLKDMAPSAPGELPARLSALRRDMRLRLEELRQLAGTNKLLTHNALRVNATILNIFRRTGGATYSNSGQVQDSGRSLNTLNKSV
ncbi:flagellar protein FlgN [Desulfallas thermosapovorans]|uniref:FlgN protein n=1 Tax=Desulfallas thermosapovorans DSM 6562 TaxID=1121431 RepID=A0A5S4ZS11_9FIRM|nr:flagellar protein FlgN [Desulfallas thermosapovorans]TYO95531.1 FlgN protein [Desulfallas thermosapovorans DSM 6562]